MNPLTTLPAAADQLSRPQQAAALTRAAPVPGVTGSQLKSRFPPRPVSLSWPATEAGRSEVLATVLTPPFALDHAGSQQKRRLSVLSVLNWLQAQPGDTWQDRWLASGAESLPDWQHLVAVPSGRSAPPAGTGRKPLSLLSPGLLVLICADLVRPSLGWLLAAPQARRNLAVEMARTRDTAAFAELNRLCAAGTVGLQVGQQALTRIGVIMAAKGGLVADVRIGDCLELLDAAAELPQTNDVHARSPLFYQLLHARGGWGEDAPAAIQVFSGRGQPSCEQLIDRYHIQCRPMRDVLVDYLRERQPSVDFSTLQHDAYLLGKLFWADLEAHCPGIDSLKLSRDVAAAWKQRVMTKTRTTATADGRQHTQVSARLDGRSVMTAVRAFYLDIAEWADDDPARWAPWAVRCPVSASDVSHKKDRSQRKSRMDQRTRERLPVLPTLTAWVHTERLNTAAVLHAARNTPPGAVFTAGGLTLRRSVMKTPSTGRVWAEHPDSGQRRDVTFDEHRGFWTWAMVEVLRHTGIRIEELTELSHHSLIQYRLPATGELIPLLQITPSKTDAERLLVISPELADVLSTIIGRIRGDQPDVPLVVSYDKNERVYNPPMPLLFQWRRRLETRTVSETSLRQYLDHALTATGITDRTGSPLRYTFHDFRRLFITDAIMHGMPPHIAQLVAGHRDINTTMGYKAVYPEEVINGHRGFIARRRDQRPSEEYRTPTDEEWEEFLGHFERRKVAMGDCGRSYATACIHEHSCLRCPLLRPDPDERDRLSLIRDNLLARIAEAETNRWSGEAEGLKVSLTGARAKLAQMDQIATRRDTAVHLGIPTFTEAAGRQQQPTHPQPITLKAGRNDQISIIFKFGEDVSDAQWLAELGAHGLVRGSFVPPQPIRELRDLTRLRTTLTRDRAREVNRLERVLQDAGIKLSSVATDILGVSGRAILEALVAGQTDPQVLAGLARMSLRKKTAQLTVALAGRFTAHHAFLVELHLRVIDQLAANITQITARITEAVKPFQPTLDLLRTIPGISDRVAVTVLAEIGDDMSQFPTAGHLASWSGVCPGHHESAGRTKQVSTRPGNNHLKAALGNAAMGAARTADCYLQSRYRTLANRTSALKALVAVEHTIIVSIWSMLSHHQPYQDLGPDYHQRRNPQQTMRRIVKQANAIGLTVRFDPIEGLR